MLALPAACGRAGNKTVVLYFLVLKYRGVYNFYVHAFLLSYTSSIVPAGGLGRFWSSEKRPFVMAAQAELSSIGLCASGCLGKVSRETTTH